MMEQTKRLKCLIFTFWWELALEWQRPFNYCGREPQLSIFSGNCLFSLQQSRLSITMLGVCACVFLSFLLVYHCCPCHRIYNNMCSSVSSNSTQNEKRHSLWPKPLKFDWAFIWQIKTYFFLLRSRGTSVFLLFIQPKCAFSFTMKWLLSDRFGSQFYLFIYFALPLIAQNGISTWE